MHTHKKSKCPTIAKDDTQQKYAQKSHYLLFAFVALDVAMPY